MNDTTLISDFIHYTSFPLVFIRLFCNEIYREKYFNLFSHIYSRKTIFERLEEKDGYFAFKNEINNILVFIENKKDYRFENYIEDTKYRLYYNYKIKPFDYDETINNLYKKYFIFSGKSIIEANKEMYDEYSKIEIDLGKQIRYSKRTGFCDKYNLANVGEYSIDGKIYNC